MPGFHFRHRSDTFPSTSLPGERPAEWLRKVVDGGFCSILLVAPLFMGGRGDVGKLVFVVLVLATATCWCLRQCLLRQAFWRHSGAEWICVAAAALIVFQITSLPTSWLQVVSPVVSAKLPLWSLSDGSPLCVGNWCQLSLVPEATRSGLMVFTSYALLFLLVVQRISRLEDVEQVLRWIGIAAVGMALLGLGQYLVGNGKFLWIYEHPFRSTEHAAKGSFANENHFAHFLALGVGPLIWWYWSISQRGKVPGQRSTSGGFRSADSWRLARFMVAMGIGVVCFAGLLTYSRGGALVILTATAIILGIYLLRRIMRKTALAGLAVVAVSVISALLIHGYQPLATQLKWNETGSWEQFGNELGRTAIWSANLSAIAQNPFFGFGVGSHRHVYPSYFPAPSDVEYTHAENGYLQVATETGVAGLALLIVGIGVCATWCFRTWSASCSPRTTACAGAIYASLAVSLLHSLVDFVWYLPACTALTVVLAACVCRLAQLGDGSVLGAAEKRLRLSPVVWRMLALGLLLVTVLVLVDRIDSARAAPDWDRYLTLAQSERTAGAFVRADRFAQADNADQVAFLENTSRMHQQLKKVVARNPRDARANARMAGMCLRRFELSQQKSDNAFSLALIRDAALASEFESRAALNQWLDKAIGPHRLQLDRAHFYARRAVQLCPLQGEAYIYLAELSFLEGNSSAARKAYIDQALQVRPFDGTVLFAAGREAALAGDMSGALEYWKLAFRRGGKYQKSILELLGRKIPTPIILRIFDPEVEGLACMYHYYRRHEMLDQARVVSPPFLSALEARAEEEKGEPAAEARFTAHLVAQFLEDETRAIENLRLSVFATPHHYRRRSVLAECLFRGQYFDEALVHLQWCLRRRPEDERLRETFRLTEQKLYLRRRAAETADQRKRLLR